MNRRQLQELISEGPVRITMNEGRSFEIQSAEFATVGDYAASVMHKDEDGKYVHAYLPLVTMCAVEPMHANT